MSKPKKITKYSKLRKELVKKDFDVNAYEITEDVYQQSMECYNTTAYDLKGKLNSYPQEFLDEQRKRMKDDKKKRENSIKKDCLVSGYFALGLLGGGLLADDMNDEKVAGICYLWSAVSFLYMLGNCGWFVFDNKYLHNDNIVLEKLEENERLFDVIKKYEDDHNFKIRTPQVLIP